MGYYLVSRSIVYSFQVNKKRNVIYTGLFTDHWDHRKQRVPSRIDFAWEINTKLDNIESYIAQRKHEYIISGFFPDKKELENHILSMSTPTPNQIILDKKHLVWEYVGHYISRKRGMKSEGYLKNWPSLQEHVKSFAPLLYFEQMDALWLESFAKYLSTVKKLSHNTVVTKITYMRILGRDAMKLGQKVAYDFEDYVPKEIKYPVVYLDWDTHINAIREVVLINQLSDVRDRFLFRCNTGMREGEMKGLKQSSFRKQDGHTWMKYYDEKAKKWKDIILSTEALEIAKKYNYKFPSVTQQEENILIKQVALLAGLTETRIKTTHVGSKVTQLEIPLFELITTHTARRSFARHWYELKGDMELLSRYLAHSDVRVTRIYIGLADVEASNELFRLMG